MKKTGILQNSVLSIFALIIVNAVLQLWIYPFLSRSIGMTRFGDILVILGIIAIFAASVGQAVNNTRIVAQSKYKCENGDANIAILILLIPGMAVLLWYCSSTGWGQDVFFIELLYLLTILKFYSDVEYRLSLNYRGYFFYYLFISLGYIVGRIFYSLFIKWSFVLSLGEAAGCIFVLVSGSIYRKPFKISSNFKRFFSESGVLFLSYLLYNAVLNLDRVLLKYLLDEKTVTIFYVASLLGKSIAILVGPLNSIAISYLSKRNKPMNRKMFITLVIAACSVSVIAYILCCFATPYFARIAYPEIVNEVIGLSPLANASQILCFLTSFVLIVVLIMASNYWQIIIQSIYAISFIVLSVVCSHYWRLEGFIIGLIITNGIRFAFTILIGLKGSQKVRLSINESQ